MWCRIPAVGRGAPITLELPRFGDGACAASDSGQVRVYGQDELSRLPHSLKKKRKDKNVKIYRYEKCKKYKIWDLMFLKTKERVLIIGIGCFDDFEHVVKSSFSMILYLFISFIHFIHSIHSIHGQT